jgi:hypothetical protein
MDECSLIELMSRTPTATEIHMFNICNDPVCGFGYNVLYSSVLLVITEDVVRNVVGMKHNHELDKCVIHLTTKKISPHKKNSL